MIEISNEHLDTVKRILSEYVSDCEVRAFGSRVGGFVKKYSDLDLAIIGNQPLDFNLIGNMREAFQESELPFRVDLIDWNQITDSFKQIIEQNYEVISKPKGDKE